MTPHVRLLPAESTSYLGPSTSPGPAEPRARVLSPSSMKSFEPQQVARPFPASAQVWSTPAVIDSKRVSVSTRTGVPLGLPAATPSWAELFSPQQYASPSSVSAQV